ncbi:DUF3782 domain-containing protein [Candidatus Bathyarchaeota archaeon]|nr:DUF3782 domain-containing protein [Candidatus Bathyarchaeota archaeon]MBS7613990.1 DUF3782 domain-containing protein [Candidatus Bathyarchaeota archaeon]MBS7617502.1 DUF3782 domain-containing protein [Candidatus Bathyarchaeota archaeon]
MELKLKEKLLKLLKEDEEFRYAVAGLIGLEEILRRLDRHEAELVKLREDMMEGFRRHDEILSRHQAELVKLREDMLKGFMRHDEEIAKLREDMNKGFERHGEILSRHEAELVRLRGDMMEGFNLLKRHLDALGARWGMLSESAFREGLKGILERELGLKVGKWAKYDQEGEVFGYPSPIDVDVTVKDGREILVEVKSHVDKADVRIFERKARFYEKNEGRKPSRLIMVAPYVDDDALELAKHLGIEIYANV